MKRGQSSGEGLAPSALCPALPKGTLGFFVFPAARKSTASRVLAIQSGTARKI